MATVDCNACEELREHAPDFVINGVTDTVCTSLKNDTGINPSATVIHADCEDLDTSNDCLVGRMDSELEAYDTCDWKKFMHKFIPNLHALLKMIICAICGLWTHMHQAEADIDNLCTLIDSAVAPPVLDYGVLPLAEVDGRQGRRCGKIGTKNGKALVRALPDDGSLNPNIKANQGIGLYYSKQYAKRCSTGGCVELNYIIPMIFYMELSPELESGDVLWYVDKATAKEVMGFSDKLWDTFSKSTWTWREHMIYVLRVNAWIQLTVNPGNMGDNYIGLEYKGTDYPNESLGTWRETAPIDQTRARLYRYSC